MEKIVLKHEDIFIIANIQGDLPVLEKETGLFWCDTRFLRTCNLLLEDLPPLFLSHTISDKGNECQIDLMNPGMSTSQGIELEEGTIHLHRLLEVHNRQMIQTFTITNFNATSVKLKLSLTIDADFCDIFEVRGFKRNARGELLAPQLEPSLVVLSYCGRDDVQRETHMSLTPPADTVSAGIVSWHVDLTKAQPVQIQVVVTVNEQNTHSPVFFNFPLTASKTSLDDFHSLETSDPFLSQLLTRSMHDLAMLCTTMPQGPYPYAGIPWFSCPFGRDALITCLEFLPWFPEVTRGTLAFLAAHQGTKSDPFTEEEPGRILHEFRRGEMANCHEIPFIPYYGCIDTTELFIIALESYIRWSNDLPFLMQLWQNAEAAAHWVKEVGDRDGDLFLESRNTSQKGLVNQGWKDAPDAISHRDGTLAEAPIALCEVQGYAYAAYRAMNYLAIRLDKAEDAVYWSQAAENLQSNFLQHFWWEDEQVFYLALDGAKQPCEVVTSNAGQSLWTGIVPESLAQLMITRLMADDMYSGWGIRTLSTQAVRYNPMGYHNGSVWPHDTALVGAGFARYGRKDEAGKLLANLSQASFHYDRARLPELFCGFVRTPEQGPVRYPVACEPQAWAAGAPFMLLSAMLGMEPDAEHHCLTLRQPALPDWLEYVELHGLHLGTQQIGLRFERCDGHTMVSLIEGTNIELHIL